MSSRLNGTLVKQENNNIKTSLVFFRTYRHYFRPFTILTRHFVTYQPKYHLA